MIRISLGADYVGKTDGDFTYYLTDQPDCTWAKAHWNQYLVSRVPSPKAFVIAKYGPDAYKALAYSDLQGLFGNDNVPLNDGSWYLGGSVIPSIWWVDHGNTVCQFQDKNFWNLGFALATPNGRLKIAPYIYWGNRSTSDLIASQGRHDAFVNANVTANCGGSWGTVSPEQAKQILASGMDVGLPSVKTCLTALSQRTIPKPSDVRTNWAGRNMSLTPAADLPGGEVQTFGPAANTPVTDTMTNFAVADQTGAVIFQGFINNANLSTGPVANFLTSISNRSSDPTYIYTLTARTANGNLGPSAVSSSDLTTLKNLPNMVVTFYRAPTENANPLAQFGPTLPLIVKDQLGNVVLNGNVSATSEDPALANVVNTANHRAPGSVDPSLLVYTLTIGSQGPFAITANELASLKMLPAITQQPLSAPPTPAASADASAAPGVQTASMSAGKMGLVAALALGGLALFASLNKKKSSD